MYKNKNGGFSLLELIVVIAIMAVLGGIVIGNSNYSKSAQVKKYTELTDGFMRKARTEIMSKNTVSGVCLYEKEGCYYIESYKEKENGGTVTFETVKRENRGSVFSSSRTDYFLRMKATSPSLNFSDPQ